MKKNKYKGTIHDKFASVWFFEKNPHLTPPTRGEETFTPLMGGVKGGRYI